METLWRSWEREVRQRADKMIVGLWVILIAVLPIIMRLKVFTFISPLIYPGSMSTGTKGDVFTFYKFLFFLLITAAAIGVFLYKMFRGRYEIRASAVNAPLLAVFLLVLLSGLAAPYKTIAINGAFNRFEGTLTYLCYFALFFIAANVEYTDRKVNMLLSALAVPAVVNAIVSLMYFYGHDLFQVPWFRALVVPPGPTAQRTEGYLVTTLANPNYLSGFASVATAVFLARAWVNAVRWRHWVPDMVLAVVSFASLLAALSTSGFFALVITVPVLAIVAAWVRVKRWWLPAIVSFVAFAGVFVGLNHHNPRVWDETFGTLIHEGQPLSQALQLMGPARAFAADSEAPNAPDGVYLPPAHTGAGTGRVYIWQRTLEMIAEKPWLGHGLDTFMFYFPQDDPEKNANLSDFNVIVDKPHNFYLDVAFGAGVPALLALLLLFVVHGVQVLRGLVRRVFPQQAMGALIPLSAGWLAYLLQGLANDSIIGISAIFWVLFGVAVSVLRRYSPKKA